MLSNDPKISANFEIFIIFMYKTYRIKCEILQSPMILCRSLLFIATKMNDSQFIHSITQKSIN